MVFFTCKVVQLLEIPEGTHRSRFRIIKKDNYNRIAMQDEFVHVYTPNAQDESGLSMGGLNKPVSPKNISVVL